MAKKQKQKKFVLQGLVLTPAQRDELHRRARESGRNISAFVRAHLFGEAPRPEIERTDDPKAL